MMPTMSCCCTIDTAWLSRVALCLWETKKFEKAVSRMVYLATGSSTSGMPFSTNGL